MLVPYWMEGSKKTVTPEDNASRYFRMYSALRLSCAIGQDIVLISSLLAALHRSHIGAAPAQPVMACGMTLVNVYWLCRQNQGILLMYGSSCMSPAWDMLQPQVQLQRHMSQLQRGRQGFQSTGVLRPLKCLPRHPHLTPHTHCVCWQH
jgi:hypothetical protein